MKRIYKYLSLVGAKLVGRRHDRDVDLPGLKELLNAFVSKSDSAITARPDFDPVAEDVLAVSGNIQFGDDDNQDDYLNSAVGIYGADEIVHLSKFAPVTLNDGVSAIACTTYTTGTVNVTIDTAVVTGVGTEWIKECWTGCLIKFGTNDDIYIIDSVTSDTSLTVTKEIDVPHVGASYVIYKTHQPNHADYKLNIQPFTSGIIYSCPTISLPVEKREICGPFYASTTSTDTETAWAQMTDDTPLVWATSSAWEYQGTSMASGGGYISAFFKGTATPYAARFDSVAPYTQWSSKVTAAGMNDSAFYGWLFYGGNPLGPGTAGGLGFYSAGETAGNGSIYYWGAGVDAAPGVVTVGAPRFDTVAVDDDGYYVATSRSDSVYVYVGYADQAAAEVGVTFATGGSVNVYAAGDGHVYFLNGLFILSSTYGLWTSSDHGQTWDKVKNLGAMTSLVYGDGRYVGISKNRQYIHYFTELSTTSATTKSVVSIAGGTGIAYGICFKGGKFYLSSGQKIWSSPNMNDWTLEYTETEGNRTFDSLVSYDGTNQIVAKIGGSGIDYPECAVSDVSTSSTSYHAAVFEPLSDDYRALTHSVLDGYVVIMGTVEYDSGDWTYYPRRIRWTTPLTYSDFSSIGSGSAELDGSGALLDSRAVNGRIVVFETSSIGALSPRGFASDPWEYDKIKDNIRTISNPVVVDDMCYFIDDSGLLRATNGINVEAPPFSFDLSEYDDFNADKPVWMSYSPDLESLCIYNPSDSNRHIYLVETESGTVSRFQAAQVDGVDPKSIVCVENSDDRRMMVAFNPLATDTDTLTLAELSTGETITGVDEWTSSTGDDTYHYTDVQTPQVFIIPEGNKTGIKHLIVNTYTDGTATATNPILVVQCKSLEDEAWHDNGDNTGTISVGTGDMGGTDTVWSTIVESGNGSNAVYTVPCPATQARMYIDSTLQILGTDYTITDTKEVTFTTPPAGGTVIYAYWENEPSVRVGVGDIVQSTEGYHRITAINRFNSATLDHYLSTGSDATATHHYGTPFPVGEGQIKIGISKLVEGVKLRFLIFHRDDGDATVTKITGVSVGHIPAGEKIVEP